MVFVIAEMVNGELRLASSLKVMKGLLLIHVGRIIFAFLFSTSEFVLKVQEKIDIARELNGGGEQSATQVERYKEVRKEKNKRTLNN